MTTLGASVDGLHEIPTLPGARVEMLANTISGWRHALSAENATVIARENSVADAIGTAFRAHGKSAKTEIAGNKIVGAGVKEFVIEP